ncbi:MAG: hypothetical protein R3240_10220, partial [Gammaproteobacteria bacterium]|nr:hypothetical protein [Gammaproteobacteria bacterium]
EENFLRVGNAEVLNDRIFINKVVSRNNSWLVVYRYDNTQEHGIGDRITDAKLSAGHHSDIELQLSRGKGFAPDPGVQLVVALHENAVDLQELDEFNSTEDDLIFVQGNPLTELVTLIAPE